METPKKAPPLGKLLKDNNLVTEQQISFSLREQNATGERLGECLMRLGIITDSDLAIVLAEQSNTPFIDLRSFTPDSGVLALTPYRVAKQFQFLPLFLEEKYLHVAISDPFSTLAAEQAYRASGKIIKTHIGGENEVQKLVERFYFLLEHPIENEIERVTSQLRRNVNSEVNVEKLVDNLLGSAISYRVTDVHISASDITTRVMYRVDGVLQLAHVFPVALHSRLITNLKVRAGMDISEQRKPQDGRLSFEFIGELFDIRVSTVKTNFGENMVMRLLASRGSSTFSIRDLGFEKENVEKLERLFQTPYGMILVTGPTGSGKTTTLYAALRGQDAIGKNILTIEDPVEYELLMIRQTQVNEKAGYTFSSAIRTFLRQDPDVMLVGEIRDEETAILGVRASLTGHLVLSTLHTNTAIGALARLRDLGISSYLLSTSLVGVIAQRLVRKLCNFCKVEKSYDEKTLAFHELPQDHKYFTKVGCPTCQNSGYLGRECVSEILVLSKAILRLIADGASLGSIIDQAVKEGFTDMQSSARSKVLRGTTSIEEMQRVMG